MDLETRHRGYRALRDRARGDARAMASLARLMHGDGLKDEAAALAAEAMALSPGDERARTLARDTLSADVPSWHFHMLRDEPRNAAYASALRRAVFPGARVLEIGTGSGILAMMAARAGAGHVYTCEVVPAIAAAAREIVARNGFADRVTVLAGHSTTLSPDDLGGPVDILVSEIFSNNLLSEGVLPALTDAMARLVAPGCAVIPAAGRIRVALAADADPPGRVGIVDGFDLSPFERLARPVYRRGVADPRLILRSAPADLFHFDFTRGGPWPPASATIDLTATADDANAVVQWIALEMDGTGTYENAPGSLPQSAWASLVHVFEGDGAAGGRRRVHGRHEDTAVWLWSEPLDAAEPQSR